MQLIHILYEVSAHTVFNRGHRVYSPVSVGEGMVESLAIATGRGVSEDSEAVAAAAANGRGEVQYT